MFNIDLKLLNDDLNYIIEEKILEEVKKQIVKNKTEIQFLIEIKLKNHEFYINEQIKKSIEENLYEIIKKGIEKQINYNFDKNLINSIETHLTLIREEIEKHYNEVFKNSR